MDKKIFFGLLFILVIFAGLVIFFGNLNSNAAFTLMQKDVLIVGASLPLSGKAASYGSDIYNGIELALSDINQSNTALNISILYDDTQSLPDKAVTSAKSLLKLTMLKQLFKQVRMMF